MRVETIGDATLYLGDCMEILPTLEKVDAVITDPPYGINENSVKVASRKNAAAAKDYGYFDWDKATPSNELMDLVMGSGSWLALFGGNYFQVPPSSCWLVWDKLNSGDFADCELCWTNWPKAVRRLQWRWNGMIRQGNEERFHPTQKPLEVMKWVIDLCPKSETILDPFAGSGTTGVAAIQLGRKFIGIEREPKYFDIACKRIEQAVAQGQLFAPEQPKQIQEALL
ncbi:MAG: DNA methyltransferase [Hyphomicrobium sp.]|jgi:site-specific DNA-methyltransferase (adenine-specific)/modification methylase